jgi:hypothetical protein
MHNRMLAASEDHAGMIFRVDATMPRSKAAIPQWVAALAELLAGHREEDALRNRVHLLS